MLALFLAAAVAAVPSPQPTPQLKVIVNVKSNSFCSSVRSLAVPLGYVTRRNDEAFAAIDHNILKFMEDTPGLSQTTVAELQTLGSALDDAATYTPSGEMDVIQMDKIAYAIVQNLTLEDSVMQKSWDEYPKGKFPAIDSFRQRMQNLMDLQRSLAEKYLAFTGTYLDNRGQARFQENPAQFKAFLRDTLVGLTSAAAASRTQSDPEVLPQASTANTAKYGSIADVVKEMRLQELAFGSEVIQAGDTCSI
jgi:hypothetical protein